MCGPWEPHALRGLSKQNTCSRGTEQGKREDLGAGLGDTPP